MSAVLFYSEGIFVSYYHKTHAILVYTFNLHQMT